MVRLHKNIYFENEYEIINCITKFDIEPPNGTSQYVLVPDRKRLSNKTPRLKDGINTPLYCVTAIRPCPHLWLYFVGMRFPVKSPLRSALSILVLPVKPIDNEKGSSVKILKIIEIPIVEIVVELPMDSYVM
jgi:hypothetical protein